MSFVINSYRYSTATAPAFAVTQAALRTTTGTQDFTVTGFGTPKAARFIVNYATSGNNPADNAAGSVGATDGTNQFVTAWAAVNGATHSGGVWDRAATDMVAMIISTSNGAVQIEASFDSFITDGVRINVSTTNARAVTVTVELFGGAGTSAKVGTSALTTQNNTTVITGLGFQPRAMFFDGPHGAFNDTAGGIARMTTGVASYDGSTIRQACISYRSDSASTTATRGQARNDAVAEFISSRYAEMTAVGSDGFTLTSRGADLSAFSVGYLALNFGGAYAAWAGILDSPTTTGDYDFTGPSFTPVFVSLRPTTFSAVNTENATGEGSAWCVNTITAPARYSNHWRDRDNIVGSSATAKSETASNAVTLSNHAGTLTFVATYVSFLSNGVRLNFTTTDGTVRKWPFLFIG